MHFKASRCIRFIIRTSAEEVPVRLWTAVNPGTTMTDILIRYHLFSAIPLKPFTGFVGTYTYHCADFKKHQGRLPRKILPRYRWPADQVYMNPAINGSSGAQSSLIILRFVHLRKLSIVFGGAPAVKTETSKHRKLLWFCADTFTRWEVYCSQQL